MDVHKGKMMRGYIGMLVVEKEYRHLGVGTFRPLFFGAPISWSRTSTHSLPFAYAQQNAGSELVKKSIQEMIGRGCEEVMLEAEVTNAGALRLYSNLGFIRDKRLQRYYLNGNDAFRLKLLLPQGDGDDDVASHEAAGTLQELSLVDR